MTNTKKINLKRIKTKFKYCVESSKLINRSFELEKQKNNNYIFLKLTIDFHPFLCVYKLTLLFIHSITWIFIWVFIIFFSSLYGLTFFVCLFLPKLRNRELWAGQVWRDLFWSATGICFPADRLAAAGLRRTPDDLSLFHCMQTPFYMLERFSSSHIPTTDPAQWLMSSDHFFVEFLCELGRPGHHLQNPWLHLQRGRMCWDSGWTYDRKKLTTKWI